MRIAFLGNFGLRTRATMAHRALPLARALADRGHTVCLILPPWDSPEDAGRLTVEAGVPIIYTATPPAIPVIRHLWLAAALTLAYRRSNCDVLYAFKPKAYAGFALTASWFLRALGLFHGRLVLDTDDWEGDGGWNDQEPAPWPRKRFVSWHERWCLTHADAVTVASHDLERRAWEAGAWRVRYLPNAVRDDAPELGSTSATIRDRLGLGDAPVVLCYTRFVEFSPKRLFAVFQMIDRAISDVHFVVVGRGLHDEDQDFAALIATAPFRDRVHQVGWIDAREQPDYFATADVAVYLLDDTQFNRSKCPMKLLYLLAAGVPVVADAVGQASEYVDDGRTGVLVPAGDVSAMAAQTVALLRDPSRRQALRTAATADVRGRWTWSRWASVAENALTSDGEAVTRNRAAH